MTFPEPPAYCCSLAVFDGDTRHVLTCPEAAARQPQREVLFDLAPRTSPDGSGTPRNISERSGTETPDA